MHEAQSPVHLKVYDRRRVWAWVVVAVDTKEKDARRAGMKPWRGSKGERGAKERRKRVVLGRTCADSSPPGNTLSPSQGKVDKGWGGLSSKV